MGIGLDDILKWGAAGVAAPFTGGQSLVLAGLSTAGDIAAGLSNKKTGNDANAQQQAGTTSANRGMSDATTAANGMLAPYSDIGGQAQNTLGSLYGFTPSPAGGGNMGMGSGLRQRNPGDPEIGVGNPPSGPPLKPYEQTLASLAADRLGQRMNQFTNPQQNAQQQTRSSFTGQGRGEGSIGVRMRTPNGQVVMVPQHQVSEAQANGGQVV